MKFNTAADVKHLKHRVKIFSQSFCFIRFFFQYSSSSAAAAAIFIFCTVRRHSGHEYRSDRVTKLRLSKSHSARDAIT